MKQYFAISAYLALGLATASCRESPGNSDVRGTIQEQEYDAIKAEMNRLADVLNYDYKVDGCYSRDLITKFHLANRSIATDSIILASSHPDGLWSSAGIPWNYHIAPVVKWQGELLVLDASFPKDGYVLPLDVWQDHVDWASSVERHLRWGVAEAGLYGGDLFDRDHSPPRLREVEANPAASQVESDKNNLKVTSQMEDMSFNMRDLELAYSTQLSQVNQVWDDFFQEVKLRDKSQAIQRIESIARHGLETISEISQNHILDAPDSTEGFRRKMTIAKDHAGDLYDLIQANHHPDDPQRMISAYSLDDILHRASVTPCTL